MKHILTIFSFISIGSISSLHAQNSMFDLGLEGGPNLSTVFIDHNAFNYETAPKIYGSGGFIFQYNFKNFLSLKAGLSYQGKGFKVTNISLTDNSGNLLGSAELSTRMDYLTFPVLAKASFGKKVQFFVNAGPYAGYLIKKTDRTIINGEKEDVSNSSSYSGLRRWDFGIASGIGIAIPIRTFWVVSIEARNYSGLLDLATNDQVKWLTNTTDLRVGVAYKLGFYKE